MLDRLWASYPQLVLDGIEDVVDEESQRGEVLLRSEDSEWTEERIGSDCFLKAGCP